VTPEPELIHHLAENIPTTYSKGRDYDSRFFCFERVFDFLYVICDGLVMIPKMPQCETCINNNNNSTKLGSKYCVPSDYEGNLDWESARVSLSLFEQCHKRNRQRRSTTGGLTLISEPT
jgi:hypothetical protein